MKQDDYEIVINCINHGAPALSARLIQSLNNVVENSNMYVEAQRKQLEESRKAAQAAKQEKPVEKTK